MKFFHFGPFAIAAIFFLASYMVNPGDGGSDKKSAPKPGQSTTLVVVNQGVSLRFRDKFQLQLEQKVPPSLGVDMPERDPIACRFRLELVGSHGSRSIHEFDQLRHGSEYYAGGTATFDSDLFDVPEGRSSAKITNLGCLKHQVGPVGFVSIGPIGEHLMLPIAAMLLRLLGWSAIALGTVLGIVKFILAKRKEAKE